MPKLVKEFLLAHALGVSRADLYAHPERKPTPEQQRLYESYLARFANHEPLAYIIGSQPFFGLDIEVNRSVLIPRPETEELVELALQLIPNLILNPYPLILDIGTGSGCIAVALAKNLPNAKVTGIDISTEALAVAQRNAAKHGVADRCTFKQIDLISGVQETFRFPFDLIISNPPYIPTKTIDTLEPNVKDWEPRGALDGGPDGLKYIRELVTYKPKNLMIFEFGFGQAEAIKRLAGDKVTIQKDASGRDRFALIEPS